MFCFGPHASTVPADSMARVPAVDGMFVGEPEEAILQLAMLESLDKLAEVPSLTWRNQATSGAVPLLPFAQALRTSKTGR
jgi:hypothetical protein